MAHRILPRFKATGTMILAVFLLATGCRGTPGKPVPGATAASTGRALSGSRTNGGPAVPATETVPKSGSGKKEESMENTTAAHTQGTAASPGGTAAPAAPTSGTAEPEIRGRTQLSDYIRNPSAWSFENFPNRSAFTLQTQIHGYAPYNAVLQEASIRNLALGDTGYAFAHHVETYEWSSGEILPLLTQAQPRDRELAVEIVKAWLDGQTEGREHPWAALESYMRYQHYAAEMGYDYIGCEIGVNVASGNLSVAFTRGAAKQYNSRIGAGNVQSWFVDFSLWNELGMVNYSGNPLMYQDPGWLGSMTAVSSNSVSGQSVSAARRAYYMAYMAGAQWLISEAGGQAAFYSFLDADGNYALTPHGLMIQEFYDFTRRNPERGVPYTPFGVVLNYDHGLPYGHWRTPLVFEVFDLNEGDRMTMDLLGLIYPDSYPAPAIHEIGQLAATPYGDTFDILLQNASQEVLDSYPVLILSGNIRFADEERERYRAYVRQGGTLVLNTAYLADFPEFDKTGSYGKGTVIVYGSDYSTKGLGPVLSDLASRHLPFSVSGEVEYLINVKDGSLVLTLINNKGVSKAPSQPVVIDEAGRQEVTVTYTGPYEVLEVRDWITGGKLPAQAAQTVVLNPGELAVLEFVV